MGLFNKLKDMVAPVSEDEEYEEEQGYQERSAPVSKYEESKTKLSNVSQNAQMVLFEPRSFDEAEEIARHLKQRRTCVVNIHKLQKDQSQRTIDFLTGVIFAIDGSIQKVAQNAILLAPSSMGVDGRISFESEDN